MCVRLRPAILVCLVTARGLLYQSKPSIEVTNVTPARRNASPANPALTPAGQRTRRLSMALNIHLEPASTSVSKSPVETADNSALAGAKTADCSGNRRQAPRAARRWPNAELGSSDEPWMRCPQKACKQHPPRGDPSSTVWRSSRELLRSRPGIPRSGLSSIQHIDSSGGCEIPPGSWSGMHAPPFVRKHEPGESWAGWGTSPRRSHALAGASGG